jgi:hypothetical protein
MTSKRRPVFRAVYLASVMFMNSASILSAQAADRNDHSYLPPWMLDETGGIKKVDEKVAQPNVPLAQEARPAKTNEPNSAGLTAKATQARTSVARYVSNFFRRSVSFTMGE